MAPQNIEYIMISLCSAAPSVAINPNENRPKVCPTMVRSYLTFPYLDRGELDGALVRAGKTDDQNIAFAQMRCGFLKIFETANRPAIGFEDDVAGREARIGGGA